MVHGTTDWGDRNPKKITYTLSDMAELAVRMGSFVNYDRRGEITWLNGFDQGGRDYQVTGTGVGNEVYLTCDQALNGGLCLVLKTGIAAGNVSEIDKYLRVPELGGIGIEATFSPDTKTQSFYIWVTLYDGAIKWDFTWMYDHVAGTLHIWDKTLGNIIVGTPGILRDLFSNYHNFKVRFNTLTNKYMRASIDSMDYELSSYDARVTADATTPNMWVSWYATGIGGGSSEVRLDNVIVTQSEPE